MTPHHHDPATTGIHADDALNESYSIAPPIFQTTTYRAEDAEHFLEMATTPHHPQFYTRYGNPNAAQAETIIATLEGAEKAMLAASGMGAITTILLHLLSAGDHVVAQTVHYSGTTTLIESLLSKFAISHTFVDQTDVEAFRDAIQPNTKVIVVETPTNPLMKLTDLAAVVALAREHGITTLADNTFATPINQRPLDLGVDVVFHSGTKYMGGHHDVLLGVIVGSEALMKEMWKTHITVGASVNGFDSWLLLRGLRTLKLRVQEHNRSALTIARALEAHPRVKAVYYPGLQSHPQHELACQQMTGFTGMLSFELDGGLATTDAFISHLTLVDRAASLGGVHSLMVHPAAMWSQSFTEEQLIARGIPPSLVRFSVGLEGVDDLLADIHHALGLL
ncbi:MAG: aminotransferase class I/II-fold pyridoxal phosphate-dependent enzyme [Chloroflexi bacterium]|nr:aminotransferase class I/II-fold pyridoxal phosphate-dependent enzyme [Chloroflexota bacterium]